MATKKKPVRNGKSVIVQKWEESEEGWGTRPDGYSLHLSDKDRGQFIEDYWDSMPDEVQEEYSRPDGEPYRATVLARLFNKVKKSSCGVRCNGTPPGDGGTDGWIAVGGISARR